MYPCSYAQKVPSTAVNMLMAALGMGSLLSCYGSALINICVTNTHEKNTYPPSVFILTSTNMKQKKCNILQRGKSLSKLINGCFKGIMRARAGLGQLLIPLRAWLVVKSNMAGGMPPGKSPVGKALYWTRLPSFPPSTWSSMKMSTVSMALSC